MEGTAGGVTARNSSRWLADLLASGVELWAVGGRLRYRALEELPDAARQRLAASKAEVIALLGDGRRHAAASFAQQRLWLAERLTSADATYNVGLALRLRGSFEVAALAVSCRQLARRHESLRTTFTDLDGRPIQVIDLEAERRAGQAEPVLVSLEGLGRSSAEREARRRVRGELYRPFDLARGPLWRTTLICLAPDTHLLILSLHHIITDGWSNQLLLRELMALYEAALGGRRATLEPLPTTYSEHSARQRRRLTEEALASPLSYWRRRLSGELPILALPTDQPRSAARTGRGRCLRMPLPVPLIDALRSLGRHHRTTFFTTALAGFFTLLRRVTGERDVLAGTLVANRPDEELEGLIGYFVNTLVLRADLSGDPSFTELLERTRELTRQAWEHQEMPFEKLVAELRPERDLGRHPFFRVTFGLHQGALPGRPPAGLEIRSEDVEDLPVRYDLAVHLVEEAGRVDLLVLAAADLFAAATVRRLARQLQRLLAEIVVDPGRRLSAMPLLAPAERQQLLHEWNGHRAATAPPPTVYRLVARQAQRTPDAAAVVWDGGALTYRELLRRGDRLGHHLRARGVGPEVPVATCLERGPELVVGSLGVLAAGGVWVPLEPSHPSASLASLVTDAGARIALVDTGANAERGSLPEDVESLAVDLPATPNASLATPLPPADLSPANAAWLRHTSGSTGRPKAVVIPQAALAGHLNWMRRGLPHATDDRVLHKTTVIYDAGVRELWATLTLGAQLVLAPPDAERDGMALVAAVRRQRVSLVHLVPAQLRQFLKEPEIDRCASLRRVLTGGEPLTRELREGFRAALPRAELWNLYGPAEATIHVTQAAALEVAPTAPVCVGRAITETRLRLLDRQGRPVGIGVVGELCAGGRCLARGYLGRPRRTASSFVPDAFAAAPGDRLYRIGDLARYHADGDLELVGRVDHQVKIRGVRIEPGEVEAALLRHPAVREAAVTAPREAGGDRRLVAWVAPADAPPAAELRRFLRGELPEPLVPALFVHRSALPRLASDKLDRQALGRKALPSGTAAGLHGLPAVPRTPVEEILAKIWREVLGRSELGVHDDFFALGGHSLLATQVISRLRRALDVEVSLTTVFEEPTLARLAEAVVAARRRGTTPPLPPVVRAAAGRELPLSFAQQRLWFLDQLQPLSVAYNMPAAYRLTGALDGAALDAALSEIVRRHAALRTRFPSLDGRPRQMISAATALALPRIDLSALASRRRRVEARLIADRQAALAFDMARGPLLRAVVVRITDREHLLVLNLSHIVTDGWSQGILYHELAALYEAFANRRPSPLPEPEVRYADFALWQRRWLRGETLAGLVAHWRERLIGMPALELPADRPRPALPSHRAGRVDLHLPAAELGELGRGAGTSLYMTSLAAFLALLHRHSGQRDLAVGSPIANRTLREIEGVIGFFVNSLVMRCAIADDPPFGDLLAQVRELALEAYTHQDLPFEKLVEELAPERDPSRHPLFQVSFAVLNAPRPPVRLAGLQLAPFDFNFLTARFDLEVYLWEAEEKLHGMLLFARDLFDATTVARLARHYERLLRSAAADTTRRLSTLTLLSPAERQQLTAEWSATADLDVVARDQPRTIHGLVALAARRTPDAVAVQLAGSVLTFAELWRRSRRLAWHLRRRGVGPETVVGLCLGRSPELITAVLAVLEVGGAYLPLDVDLPPSRSADLVKDANAPLVIAEPRCVQRLAEVDAEVLKYDALSGVPAAGGRGNAAGEARAANAAWVLYTSGTTGRPKGVVVSHAAALRYLRWSAAHYAPRDRAGQLGAPLISSLSFDLTVTSLFVPLLSGHPVTLLPEERDLAALAEALVETPAFAFVKLTPSHLEMLRHALDGRSIAAPGALVVGGEALRAEALDFWRDAAPACRIFNEYGPTEAVVGCVVHRLATPEPRGSVPIGRPFGRISVRLTDGALAPVPAGAPGELWIGGPGLARGYLRRPRETAAAFRPDPWSSGGARLYKTGDRARFLADGRLDFLGRVDQQVKIRGVRIEPAELEEVLRRHPAVTAAAVVAGELGSELRLVACVVPAGRTTAGDHERWQGEHVAEWQSVYENLYRGDGGGDPAFDLAGWTRADTGEAIAPVEMREWLERTVARIRALEPRRVLEIGCGTGLLLHRLAPDCQSYLGTDFSAAVLRRLGDRLGEGAGLPGVELRQRPADDFAGIDDGGFDTVILNSVVQYFPDAEYLRTVLRGALAAVAPGGAIFIGDVRSLPLHRAFCASVELARAPASMPLTALAENVRRRVAAEPELLLHPAFFSTLARELPRRVRVRVLPKRGRYDNELTRFRYDVILELDADAPVLGAPRLDWRDEGLSLDRLRRLLSEQSPPRVWLTRVPNRRLAGVLALEARLERPGADRVAELRRELAGVALPGVTPEELCAAAAEMSYRAEPSWVEGRVDGSFDAVLVPEGELAPPPPLPPSTSAAARRGQANQPLGRRQLSELVPLWRSFLAEHLPAPMLPAHYVILEQLPRRPGGKLDRAALGRAARSARGVGGVVVAPRNALERGLADIWAGVLGLEEVGVHDNFFDLGGHSLNATQVVSRARRQLGRDVVLRRLFDAPTIAELAASLADDAPSAPPVALGRRRRGDELPLSFAQQRLWFLAQLEPESAAYNMPAAWRLAGVLDMAALEAALTEIVRRHEALRTCFPSRRGQPRQEIVPAAPAPLPVVDLGRLSSRRRDLEARRRADAEAMRPFDVERGPLLRALVLRLGRRRHVLLLNQHHIVSDGWSQGVFYRELAALYAAATRGRRSPLVELPIQYADFALWQRQEIATQLEAEIAYWRRTLAGASAVELPADRPRPAVQSYRGGVVPLRFGPALTRALRRLGQGAGASLFMMLLSGMTALLGRLAGRREAVVGTLAANRTREELEGLIGFFVNSLVMRGDLAGNPSFTELVARIREAALGAFAHQNLPFERLVDELRLPRDLARHPLFQISFALQNMPRAGVRMPGLELVPEVFAHPIVRFDLEIHLSEIGDALTGRILYATDLFDATTLSRLATQLGVLLEAAATRPARRLSELPLLDASARHQLLREWNATGRVDEPWPGGVHRLVARQAARVPDAVAVAGGDAALTYAELMRRSAVLARRLRNLGVVAEARVAVLASPSPARVAALLAVLEAGAAYVPLDPDFPARRLGAILEDCGAMLLVSDGSHTDLELPATLGIVDLATFEHVSPPVGNPPRGVPTIDVAPESLAYVIYTSGSTGRPKGVQICHRALVSFLRSMARRPGLDAADVLLAVTTISFDIAALETFLPLVAGARLELAENTVGGDGHALSRTLAERRATVMQATPASWRLLLETGRAMGGLRVLCGGEALPRGLGRQLAASGETWNLYGPTETTVWSAVRRVRTAPPDDAGGHAPVSLGRPIDNTDIHLLDRHLRPVALGVTGEVAIGGAGLLRGYFGRPALSAEKVVPDPWGRAGARLYLTGDLARRRAAGELDFLGRRDHQVKVQGHRIELGEIESVLAGDPAVREVAAAVHEADETRRLVAHLVLSTVSLEDESERRRSERERLDAWRQVWQSLYSDDSGDSVDSGDRDSTISDGAPFDVSGWISSYTGEQVPATEMREWVRTTVERILALEPRRVLELGVGTGLLLDRIAPRTERYLATDFSPAVLAALEGRLGKFPHVRLACRAADDFTGLGEGFDTVILNSLVQYFPSIAHLHAVLGEAVRVAAPGARIFVGDVRSLPLLEAFCATVELARSIPGERVGVLRERVRQRLLREEELLVDPAFFFAFAADVPRLTGVRVLPRAGLFHNEMTRFRYDVVLHLDGPPPAPVHWLDARKGAASLAQLEQQLAEPRQQALGFAGVPNARLARAMRLVELLRGGPADTAGELRNALEDAAPGLEPDACTALAAHDNVALSWGEGAADGSFDVVLWPPGRHPAWAPVARREPLERRPWGAWGNDPLRAQATRSALPRLRHLLGERLPMWMQPAAWVIHDALPRLPNGKVARRRLPAPGALRAPGGESFTAPRTPIEEVLAKQWQEVLELERVGVHDNFFELGGDSILSIQIVARARRAGLTLTPRDLFQRQTIAELAAAVDIGGAAPAHAGALAPFALAGLEPSALRGLRAELETHGAEVEDLYPLSPTQHSLLYFHLYTPESTAYFEVMVFRLEGELDTGALRRSWRQLFKRHPVLRSDFVWKDLPRPLRVVRREAEIEWTEVDLRHLPPVRQRMREAALRRAAGRRGYDFGRAPLARLMLVRLSEHVHHLVWSFHHILLDGWSLPRVSQELIEHYRAAEEHRQPRLSALRPFGDYIAWLESHDRVAAEAYWRRSLRGFHRATPLPDDRPASGPSGAATGVDSLGVTLKPSTSTALRAFARRHHLTLNTLFQATWALLLARFSGHTDVLFGATLSGRPADLEGVETMVGTFINTSPVRVRVSPHSPLGPWLARLQAWNADMREHGYCMLFDLQRWSDVPAGEVLFESTMIFQNYPTVQAANLAGDDRVSFYQTASSGHTSYALTFMVYPRSPISIALPYDRSRFDRTTVSRLLTQVEALLAGFLTDSQRCLGDLPALPAAARHQLLWEWNDSAGAPVAMAPGMPGPESFLDGFSAAAWRAPDAVALVAGRRWLSYRELERRASALAGALCRRGIGPEDVVAILTVRSVEMVVAMLAVDRVGAAYVPLDPLHPEQRTAFILRQTRARLVLTLERLEQDLPAAPAVESLCLDRWSLPVTSPPPRRQVPAASPAYVIYTSGSTGQPKGVVISHGARDAYARAAGELFALSASDRVLQFASLSFDTSVEEIFSTLAHGAALVLRDERMLRSPSAFLAACAAWRVSVLDLPTAYWHDLAAAMACDDLALPTVVRLVIIGGEGARPERLEAWRRSAAGVRLLNTYGPTEATVVATVRDLSTASRVTIGHSLAGIQAHVLDRRGRPSPSGAPGELHLGGVGLARGYLGAAAQSAERFVPEPFSRRPGERLYRTGDRARRRPDGELEHLGRIDAQVKIRGLRIELGEVENILAAHPDIAAAAVVVRAASCGPQQLDAWVVPRPDTAPTVAEMRRHLGRSLPFYMLPASFGTLDELPLLPSRKVDRRALAHRPPVAVTHRENPPRPPRDVLEEALIEIWREVLGIDQVGVDDDYFGLGGNSLSAVQLMARLEHRFGVELSLALLFRDFTVSGIARILRHRGTAERRSLSTERKQP